MIHALDWQCEVGQLGSLQLWICNFEAGHTAWQSKASHWNPVIGTSHANPSRFFWLGSVFSSNQTWALSFSRNRVQKSFPAQKRSPSWRAFSRKRSSSRTGAYRGPTEDHPAPSIDNQSFNGFQWNWKESRRAKRFEVSKGIESLQRYWKSPTASKPSIGSQSLQEEPWMPFKTICTRCFYFSNSVRCNFLGTICNLMCTCFMCTYRRPFVLLFLSLSLP